jgi:3-oxoacyl-[acyl-carrier protein] reductase
MNHELTGQTALVTGASRGIGRAIASTLAAHGATVVGTSTSEAGAAGITEDLSATGKAAGKGVVLDVCDAAACEAVIDAIQKEFGSLGILVNNAGITQDMLAMRMKDDDWNTVIATNLSAVFRLSRGVLRGMIKARGGRIVNITSVVGSAGNAGQANYAAAKAGVAGMTRALAKEVGSRGITVNCVAPGFIDTDMTKSLSSAQIETLTAQIPLARLGRPEDIAAAVAFLVSPQAAYITGTTLHVNGGMYM